MTAHPDAAAPAIVAVTELVKQFGGVRAVDGASFAVRRGTITGLIGPNGAGKSTSLSMIAGALKPTSGSIAFGEHEIAGLMPHRVAHHGIIRTFQLSSEFARLSVLENLLVPVDMRGTSLIGALLGKRYWGPPEARAVERARALLRRFGMEDKQDEYAGSLSGGQKRLLEIMRALMADPIVLLLDEPMAGVNPTMGRRIEEHLLELREDGITMLMVEHDLGTMERVCDPVVVMAQGRVIAEGAMRELRTNRSVLEAYLVG